MTTIAYKDGIIAYDSRLTQGSRIASDTCEKMHKKGKDFLVWAGAHSESAQVLEALIVDKYPDGLNLGAGIAMIGGKLYAVGLNEDDLWKCDIKSFSGGVACGSGSGYAIGAMDMGADAISAVKIASKRDSGTGGKIRIYKVSSDGLKKNQGKAI